MSGSTAAAATVGLEVNRAFLMGRKSYHGGAAYWPTSTDEPYATYCNDIKKFVISNTLENPTWKNTTVVPGEVEAVQQMKDSVDGQIFMTGSATTVRWLLANNLLDELRLLLHPVVVGSGQKLVADGPGHRLELVEQQALSTGVVHLRYSPAI